MVYGGFIDLDSGERVSARAEYHFSVTTGNTPDTLIPVRVPVNATAGLNATFRLDTAWIRDLQNYALGTFLADVEQSVYDGVLADPVYRWRDNQLGFYVYTREGFVTSYYSARDTRCGKNPWPTDPVFPAALASMEVLGLLHRRVANAQGVEGRVTGPTANLFRDCAGRAVRQPEVRTFSTTAGIGETPLIAKHEFGHAAFGLGDEYTEPDATRRVSAPIAPPDSSECCCLKASGGGGSGGATMTGGGQVPIGGVKRCVGPNGSIQELPTRPLDAGLLACDAMNSTISQACWAQPDTGCPSLAGDCVVASAWLGQSAPVGADSARPNVFPSQQSCMDAASRAAAHPGVEDASRSIGSCRPLCGATTQPCPCGAPEFWVADLNPGVGATPPPRLSDAMAVIAAPPPPDLLGGTCAWCIETSLCVRWHRALGDPAQKSWDACQAPPKAATSFERVWAAFFRWLADLLRQIVNPMKF
jgi:hypothetical protein